MVRRGLRFESGRGLLRDGMTIEVKLTFVHSE